MHAVRLESTPRCLNTSAYFVKTVHSQRTEPGESIEKLSPQTRVSTRLTKALSKADVAKL
jgi:hypothetical protein